MEKKNIKPLVFIAFLFSVLLIVGGTIAYYTSSDTFNNEFDTGTYKIETQEAFVSPDNWTPGTTTPKTVIATNKGTTPAAVRIKLTPSWVDANGDPLPLKDNDDNYAAVINFTNNFDKKWIYQDGYYYYKRALNEEQSTTSLLKSVTFNPDFDINNIKDCETVNGVTTCTTEFTDYAGGKYTLQVEVETAQYDQYKEIWGTTIELKDPILVDGVLKKQNSSLSSIVFGNGISRMKFEKIITVDNINIPDSAIGSWDVSANRTGAIMAWYTDEDNDNVYELYIGQEDGVKANPDSSYVFSNFTNVNYIDLSNFDTSNVTDMSDMFSMTGNPVSRLEIVGLDNFDTSNVTNMGRMFFKTGYNATTWDIGDISNWDTSKVNNMSSMFNSAGYNATTFNIGNINNWDTSNVISMSSMFNSVGYNATTFNLNLGNWNTSKVTSMESMFESAGHNATTFNLNLGNWDTSSVTNMNSMFNSAGYGATTWNVENISGWNTSKVIGMASMFNSAGYSVSTFNLDLSNWNVSKVESMSNMFASAGYSATTWNIGNLSNWNTEEAKHMGSMFFGAGYNATTFNIGNLNNWDTSKVTGMSSMFNSAGYKATTWNIGDLSGWNTSNVTDMSNMFASAGYSATTWNSIGTLKIYASNMLNMFNGCGGLSATINIYNNPTSYARVFNNAATKTGSGVIVNYNSSVTDIDAIVATKSSSSNVVKGSQLD